MDRRHLLYFVLQVLLHFSQTYGKSVSEEESNFQENLVSPSPGSSESRVAYGKPAFILHYPFFAFLGDCGGAILSERWVITAAHCVTKNYKPGQKLIKIGQSKFHWSQTVEFDEVVIHPEYEKGDIVISNDIALLRLTKPLKFGMTVKPINLPTDDGSVEVENILEHEHHYDEEDPDLSDHLFASSEEESHDISILDQEDSSQESDYGPAITYFLHRDEPNLYGNFHYQNKPENLNNLHTLVAAGVDENGNLPGEISTVQLIVSPTSKCFMQYESLFSRLYPFFVSNLDKTTLCGTRYEDLPGPGEGDSGSPLVKNNVLVGIVSFKKRYRVPETFWHSRVSYFTKVSAYVPWIKKVTGL